MRICKLDLASQIYGAGGPSFDWAVPAPAVQAPVQPAVNSLFSGGGSGGHTSVNGSSSGNASLGGFLGSIFSTDSGVANGKRDDGQPLGYGCGDAKTDAGVPDHIFGRDLIDACRAHDKNYETCGVTKEAADSQLGHDVSVAMGGGLLGAVVGGAYQAGVSFGGQSAYNQAQSEAGCRNTGGGGGGVATGGSGGDASGGGDRGTRGGF